MPQQTDIESMAAMLWHDLARFSTRNDGASRQREGPSAASVSLAEASRSQHLEPTAGCD
jgi:hypothetical protein